MTLMLGGARAGKSGLAARLAAEAGTPVTFIATAQALDDDMAARIARHQADRPAGWTTIEEPLDLSGALGRAGAGEAVIVDCLTLWVTNMLLRGDDDETVVARANETASVAARREGRTIVVTNEVGSGVVPMAELGRRFRDVLGHVNSIWSGRADDAYLVVAGRTLTLEAAP
jgi:adenosylcobinamide kinase/adenosylcobinamide-phosphate guanylyltransferase